MPTSIQNQFRAALKHLLQQGGRGAQAQLAVEQNIDRGYLNAIIKGRKPGAEDTRAKIASYFGMAYEEMLALGRRILKGKIDQEVGGKPEIPVSPDWFRGKETIGENTTQGEGGPGSSVAGNILKVLEILKSGTEHADSLSEVIDAYYRAIITSKENQEFISQLKTMEDRVRQLEKILSVKIDNSQK